MALVANNQSVDGSSAGVLVQGPVAVHVRGPFAGAIVQIEASDEDVDTSYSSAGLNSKFNGPGWCRIEISGEFYIRSTQRNSGDGSSITVVTI